MSYRRSYRNSYRNQQFRGDPNKPFVREVTFGYLREMFVKFWENGSKGDFTSILKNGRSDNVAMLREHWNNWQTNDGWTGATGFQMIDWLKNGFHIEGIQLQPELMPVRKKRRMNYSDFDGEYQHDMMLSGYDYPYLIWDKRESVPGIDFDISMSFSASTDQKFVVAYQSWVLKVINALETSGIDCNVHIHNSVREIFKGTGGRHFGQLTHRIRVKESGKAHDLADWSAILSPGGYRILGFFGKMIAADHFGYGVVQHLGFPIVKGWGVEFNAEKQTIEIHQPNSPNEFPEELMNLKLREAIELSKGI